MAALETGNRDQAGERQTDKKEFGSLSVLAFVHYF